MVRDYLVEQFRWEYLPRNVMVFCTKDGYLLQWVSGRGFVYSQRWCWWRLSRRGDRRAQVMHTVWEGPVKRKNLTKMESLSRHVEPDKLLSAYPNLLEFMTAAGYEGEEGRRESPTVTIWAGGGSGKQR